MPDVVETIAGLRSQLRLARVDAVSGGLGRPRVALVPTMGALHDGHLALVERAKERAEIVVVSIFVNPLQFGPSEDLALYPRTVESDVERLAAHGVQIVFAPTVGEIYPGGDLQTKITAGDIGSLYEGRSRRGHFDGVLTVVAKLLNIVRPDTVVFGEKDAQQVFLVKRMIADLNVDVDVAAVTTVREDDGLALSSRNRFLDPKQRRAARSLSIALEAASSSADRGIDSVIAAAQSVLTGDSTIELDYLAVVDPTTFLPVDDGAHGRALVLIAARVGETRLIDNVTVYLA
ncbi:MAG: pantoate--beta-alanine ligase [Burkholderiaceae bacterium]|nr:pantoate--beta-alanine ligase [Microbacteriaceae bacterium]